MPVRAERIIMSLFNDIGRKVETLKQEVEKASDDEATHQCSECETRLYTDHDECPDCGSTAVLPLSD
jgi:rRNA maturation endonuclease Nob1